MVEFNGFKASSAIGVLIRSPSLQVAVMFGVAGLGFSVANIILARSLTTRDYALVALAVSLINLSYPLAPLGMESVVVRRVLGATRQLFAYGLLTAIATGVVTAVLGALIYGIETRILVLIFVSIVGGGTAYLASARFQSLERFPTSVILSQGSNYFLLVAALVTIAFDWRGVVVPLLIVALGHIVAAFLGWGMLFGPDRSNEPIKKKYFLEALVLAGSSGAVLLLLQLERLMIPKVLGLEQLATYGVLAAIVIAPFRILQMGASRTLLPRLRNEPTVAGRRRLLVLEGVVVGSAVVVLVAGVWYGTPLLVKWFLQGKYYLPVTLILAALIVSLLKVISGFTNAAVIALASTRELAVWNALGWLFVGFAIVGGVLGAHWDLSGLLYGVSIGWLGSILAAIVMLRPHLSATAHSE